MSSVAAHMLSIEKRSHTKSRALMIRASRSEAVSVSASVMASASALGSAGGTRHPVA